MKTIPFIFSLLFCTISLFGQTYTTNYDALIRQADSLYQVKDYEKSGFATRKASRIVFERISFFI